MIELIKNPVYTLLPDGNRSGIILKDVRWSVKTAGPSPFENERVELFLLGCNKAMTGNPCEGCFNSSTWDSSKTMFSHDPIKMAEHINNCAKHKYITVGGGEPTDQIENLTILFKELKKYGFHIMMYTWRTLKYETSLFWHKEFPYDYTLSINKWIPLFNYVDIIVDGEYIQSEHKWDGEKEDGLISSVGSGNQIIWDIPNKKGYSMRDIDSISLDENNSLEYLLKDQNAEMHRLYM